ncbi:aminotransferase class V-fold PLP-dependent enzyme [Pseudonocardia sp. KRD-184]|uniref:Aminotransferase class V-fold PLP-dependent enzyme n=1 Tax=Pseudonocardia oceani TaxID=2792013 RepID=A0ABS6U957_9PSEU|nr:aminotransferase class V-fold PLP-dependent enzyme [Pseudonocardia oceani]MBW0091799.1 aminotransferase class V-fold PLP-dependent enzyme [Pseudonocardia oceani]MBW0098926.1 aminotransferase class V-fold PLP-dependent enzyme [Pseudonocardia oceani]MBW0109409.1 aminotransferase class V-fold PLP-dependent enzyme [Pseudonocardia oceani]MBW0123584.1 aminotransferase class V-fold PLP-dependent enzyme [Pseudonocardia oceani]MBW0128780.1 aminotransferase class V-fold PLP-dependent enzyme [Pseudono
MAYDVARVRGLIPALGDGWVHLDAAVGMQPPEDVVSAVSGAFRRPRSAPGAPFAASRHTADVEHAARSAVADLVGGDPRGVVLGPGPAVLLARLADAVADTWVPGDEVVLSRLDDAANVLPWLRAAHRRDVAVRWAEIGFESCELPAWQFDDLLSGVTRVVAVTAASGQVGTRVDVPAVAARTRSAGALLVVDACAAAAYGPVRLDDLGADVVALDAAAWGGPHLGALVFRTPALLDRLTNCSLDPTARGPRRLEVGPHSTPQLAGLVASVDHLAALDDTATGTRAERLHASLEALHAYQDRLLDDLLLDLVGAGAIVLGSAPDRIPALALTHAVKAAELAEHLAGRGICVVPDPGEQGVLAHLGTAEIGGVVRVGLGHYTTPAETRALAAALASL